MSKQKMTSIPQAHVDNLYKRIAELEKTLKAVKKDLLMRAEEDSEGCKVVELSSSVWVQLKEALKEQVK